MRFILFAALLAISACERLPDEQRPHAVAEGCAHHATHDVTWSNSTAPDVVTASSSGPTCAQATVTLTIRNSAGDPLWVFASTYYDMTIGGRGPEEPPPVSEADIQAFLARWADVSLNKSSELPAWTEGAPSLTEAVQGMSYSTDFDRDTYEMLRVRDLPQLCFAAATETSHCLVIDPLSNAPTVIVAFGP